MRRFLVENFWAGILAALLLCVPIEALAMTTPATGDGMLVAKRRKKRSKRRRSHGRRGRRKRRGGKIKIEKEAPAKAPTTQEEELPSGPAKIKLPMVEEKKAAGATLEEKLLDEEIKQLQDIIRTTPEGPAKADLLFRLAERYYEKARSIYYREMQAYDKAVEAWMKKQETHPNLPEPKINNRKSQVYTKQAMDVYRIILKRYKDYRRSDEVLFTMGYNLYESGNKSEGMRMYWELIKKYPKSRFLADAYLAMGEHFFNSNDVFKAKKSYERAMAVRNSKVYTYALYKLAWCDYNLGDYDAALEKFKKVVQLATREAAKGEGGDRDKIQLKREALQDMVLTFSQLDALEQAEQYWMSQVGKRGTLEYMRKLARTYEKQGKAEMTVKAFRRLLDEYPTDPDCPSYHSSIVLAYRKMNQRNKVTREINRIIEQYRPGSQWWEVNKSNKMATKRAYALVESLLRDLVTSYHQEAQETKRWDTYNLARKLYAKYMESFPDSEYAYKLGWYYADVLYKMGDFYGAAQQYSKVVKKDPKGPFSAEAAYDAVLSWDKCMELRDRKHIDCRKWQATKTGQRIGKEEERTIKEERIDFDAGLKGARRGAKQQMESQPIPFFEKKFLEAADIYARVAPQHDMYIPIRFKSAFIFYKYHHYKEMARRFGEIIERYPRNQFALKAVRLSLNTMYIKAHNMDLTEKVRTEHWKEINHWAKVFKKNKILMNSPAARKEKFANEIQSLIEESGYNVVLALRKQDPLRAAQGFDKFVHDYPESKFAHRALYAAMIIYDEANQLDLAIRAGQRLLKNYPSSDRYNQTVLALADFHNRVADFARAARYNEMFFKSWQKQQGVSGRKKKKKSRRRRRSRAKKAAVAKGAGLITDKQARDALYNAALLRESMGQYSRAIKNYVKYINTFPDAPDVHEIFYKVGMVYQAMGDTRKADRVWEAYPDKYRDRAGPDRLLEVLYKHALALRKLGRAKESDSLLDKILDAYNQLPEKARSPEARHAAANARFLQLEDEFTDYVNIKLVLPPRTLKRNLFKKIDIRPKLEKKYEEVVAFKDPDFAIAALVRIGQLSQNLSQSMYDAPIPAGLTPDQQDIYVQELQNQALPLEEKAMALFRRAIDVSCSKGVYNDWTLKAQELLKSYQPSSYPPPFQASLKSTEYIYSSGFSLDTMEVPPAPPAPPAAGPESATAGEG